MGVSRNRKNHAKKSRQRSLIEKNKKAKAKREFIEMMQNAQKEAQQKQEEEQNVVGVEEMGDIGQDLKIDTE